MAVGLGLAGLVLLLWPLHAAAAALPEHRAAAQLAQAQVSLPQDVVDSRRRLGGEFIAGGLILAVGGAWAVRRR